MKTKHQSNGVTTERNGAVAKRVIVKGKHAVMLDEAEFDRLMRKADLWEPLLPEPDADGNYPAEIVRVDLAIDIIRHRRRLGLTQVELARRAGIRPETLNRIESGVRSAPAVRTIEKIDRALREAEEAGVGLVNGKHKK